MNTPFDKLLVGSWEILSTNKPGVAIEGNVLHFSSDGKYTWDAPPYRDFVYPGRYRVEEEKLIFIWKSWGKEDNFSKLSLEENGDLKIVDHKGCMSFIRRLSEPGSQLRAYLDSEGKLRKRKRPVLPRNNMSLVFVEMLMTYEEVFGIDIPDATAETLTTVGLMYEFIIQATSSRKIIPDPEAVWSMWSSLHPDNCP